MHCWKIVASSWPEALAEEVGTSGTLVLKLCRCCDTMWHLNFEWNEPYHQAYAYKLLDGFVISRYIQIPFGLSCEMQIESGQQSQWFSFPNGSDSFGRSSGTNFKQFKQTKLAPKTCNHVRILWQILSHDHDHELDVLDACMIPLYTIWLRSVPADNRQKAASRRHLHLSHLRAWHGDRKVAEAGHGKETHEYQNQIYGSKCHSAYFKKGNHQVVLQDVFEHGFKFRANGVTWTSNELYVCIL